MPANNEANRDRILHEAAEALWKINPHMHGLRAQLIDVLRAADDGDDPAEALLIFSAHHVPDLVSDGDLASAAAIEEFAARCFQLRNHHAQIKRDAELDAIL